jgi:hypothetical protein
MNKTIFAGKKSNKFRPDSGEIQYPVKPEQEQRSEISVPVPVPD